MGHAASREEVSSEHELVAAVNAGDAAAFERLFRDWYEPLAGSRAFCWVMPK